MVDLVLSFVELNKQKLKLEHEPRLKSGIREEGEQALVVVRLQITG